MRHLLAILFALSVSFGWAQTQNTRPTGAVPYGSLWLTPDGNVWSGSTTTGFTNLGNWEAVSDSLDLRWTKAQVDSAISTLTKADVGLGNVDNTSDMDKPVSDAQQAALDLKLSTNGGYISDYSLMPSRGFWYTDNMTTGQPNPSAFGTGFALGRTSAQRAALWVNPNGSSGNILYLSTSSNSGDTWRNFNIFHSGNFTPPSVFTRTSPGLVPNSGGSGSVRFLREDGAWVDPQAGGGGGTATNLTIQNRTSSSLVIGSSTGSGATIPSATGSLAGLMSGGDKTKLDEINVNGYLPLYPSRLTQNLEDLRSTGAYSGGTGVANRPPGNYPYSPYMVLQSGGDRYVQLWFNSYGGTDNIFYRNGTDVSWGPWRTLWHDGNLPNPAQLGTGSTQVRNNSQLDSRYASISHTHTVSQVTGAASVGTGGSDVRTNNQLDERYLQSVSAGSGISVTGGNTVAVNSTVLRTTGNQTVGGTKTFSSPVVVPNATASNHAVTLGQVNSLVPEKPDWTQYVTESVSKSRPAYAPTGYYDIGAITSLGVDFFANVLANSFINEGDAVEVDGIIEVTGTTAGNNYVRIGILGDTHTLQPGSPCIYDINIRFRYNGGNSVSYIMKVYALLGVNVTSRLNTYRGTKSITLSNNILIAAEANTLTGNVVNVNEVRVTKYSAKYYN